MLKTQQVERALVTKLGFEMSETHHRVFRLWLDGQLMARTYISHGERELSAFHTAQMAKQVQLSKEQFFDAVNCPLSQDEYYDIVRARRRMSPRSDAFTASLSRSIELFAERTHPPMPGKHVRQIIATAHPRSKGHWLFVPIETEQDVRAVRTLPAVKAAPH